MKKPLLLTVFGTALLLTTGCLEDNVEYNVKYYSDAEYAILSQELNLPSQLDDYTIQLAPHMQVFGARTPTVNLAKATLGRVLFYDTKLSRNETVSCASCHKQGIAFSDDKALSIGFNGETTKRNSQALAAVANFESSYDETTSAADQPVLFFWDERAHSIAEQSELTLQDPVEMGMDLNDLATRLQGVDYYPILFQKAYNSSVVTPERITDALQEFCNTFVSVNSRFDRQMDRMKVQGEQPTWSQLEEFGAAIYRDNCGNCHSQDMTTPMKAVANNGLDLDYADKGVGGHTGRANEYGIFKVPFLRNIALTAPYMHDGRFATLEEVIDHYSEGIQAHPNLSPELRSSDGSPRRMNFTSHQKAALIAFLETVTDEQLINDPKFSDPFKR
jgi:cytochrome c peroxidase